MAPDVNGPALNAPRRLRLFVDFDDTLTTCDTINLLVQCAARKLQSEEDRRDLLDRWHALEEQYFPRYQQATASSLQAVQQLPHPGTGPEPISALEQYFGPAFDELEDWSLQVLWREGFLRGLHRDDLRKQGASAVKLKEGAVDVLKTAIARGALTRIVSVNWSQDLIRGKLEAVGIPTSDGIAPQFAAEDAPADDGAGAWAARVLPASEPLPVPVFACDLEYGEGGAGPSTGRVVRRLTSARHKRDVLRALAAVDPPHEGGPSVYVGDSVTDLLAMLEADVGVVVGESGSLGRLCHTLRIPILPLPRDMGPASRGGAGRVLFRAASWPEIGSFLFGSSAEPGRDGHR